MAICFDQHLRGKQLPGSAGAPKTLFLFM